MIRVQELGKTYPGGVRALDGVSLSVEPGEGVVLLGSNGSGKSTLLRCLIGFERASDGRIEIDGIDVTASRHSALRRVRREVGMVFQRFHLVPGLSAFANVMMGALGRTRLWRLTTLTASAADRRQAMTCLDRVGLAHIAAQRTDTLSGGQQQRVAIARMLMQRPRIVLADEPIASLDPRAGREVMDLLWGIAQEQQLTVICTLHQLDAALHYGRRIIGLRDGRKVLDQPRAGLDAAKLHGLYDQTQAHSEPIETLNHRAADPLEMAAAEH